MVMYEDKFYPVMLYKGQQVYFNPVSLEFGVQQGDKIIRPDIFLRKLMAEEGLDEIVDDMLMDGED